MDNHQLTIRRIHSWKERNGLAFRHISSRKSFIPICVGVRNEGDHFKQEGNQEGKNP